MSYSQNSRWGFSLDEAKVCTKFRYEKLLLVAVLATFAVWLTGKVAELKKYTPAISSKHD